MVLRVFGKAFIFPITGKEMQLRVLSSSVLNLDVLAEGSDKSACY
jgi:hypothetical protein